MSGDPELSLVGIDYDSARPEMRAQFHLTRTQIEAVYYQKTLPTATIILSTCNRTEIYFGWAGNATQNLDCLRTIYQDAPVNPEDFYYKSGESGLLHLLELAVGLKSQLIGETEILGQIEAAWQTARHCQVGLFGLETLFGKILVAARRIRQQTNIGGSSSSLYTLVIRELKQHGAVLSKHSALVLGNGAVAQKMARVLQYHGITTTILTRGLRQGSRQRMQPVVLVEGAATVFGYDHLERLIAEHDLIIAATAAPHPLIKVEHSELLKQKVLIDLAFPRNVDPALGKLGNCTLWDLDYFASLAEVKRQAKEEAVKAAKSLCLQTIRRFFSQGEAAGPVLVEYSPAASQSCRDSG